MQQNGSAKKEDENHTDFFKNLLESEIRVWETTASKMVFLALIEDHTI